MKTTGKKTIGKKTAIALVASACLVAICAAGAIGNVSASANSAPAYWYGSDGMGVMPTEDCPVEVKREALTLEIPSLPKTSYSSQEEFDEYGAQFTAEYTFYNPTDETLTAELAFPFGTPPEYLFDRTGESTVRFDDSARFGVTVGGEAAETELRYTYYDGQLALPAKEKAAGDIYKEDADLYEFSYEATAGVDLINRDYYLEVCLSYSPLRTRILCENYRDYLLEDGDLVLLLYLNGDPVHFWAVGEKPQIKYTKVAKQGNGLYNSRRTYVEDAQIEMRENSSTFGTWVGETRPDGVGEVDWYNAAVAYLESFGSTRFGLSWNTPSSLSEEDLMRWFSYTLEIPAKGSVVNAVTGPFYPEISGNYYRFRYLLSPAQAWAKFGEFSLTVTTPYTVEDCKLSLEEAEGGYTFTRDGLPLDELEFTIYGEGGSAGGGYYEGGLPTVAIVILCSPLIYLAIKIIALLIGLLVHGVHRLRHRRRKKAK